MRIVIKRKLWAKSGTWNLAGEPNCVGGHTMNSFGFPMKQFKDPDFGPSEMVDKSCLSSVFRAPGAWGPYSRFFDFSQDKICKEHNFDMSFQNQSSVLNDTKDEIGLAALYASKGIELVFED